MCRDSPSLVCRPRDAFCCASTEPCGCRLLSRLFRDTARVRGVGLSLDTEAAYVRQAARAPCCVSATASSSSEARRPHRLRSIHTPDCDSTDSCGRRCAEVFPTICRDGSAATRRTLPLHTGGKISRRPVENCSPRGPLRLQYGVRADVRTVEDVVENYTAVTLSLVVSAVTSH